MINLLPLSQRFATKREYRLRRAIIFLLFANALIIVASLLLLPVYVEHSMLSKQYEEELRQVSLHAQNSEAAGTLELVEALNTKLARIHADAQFAPSTPALLSALEKAGVSGIALAGIEYERAAAKDAKSTLTLSGVATSRASLRSYIESLEMIPLFIHVDSPISNLTKSRNLDFIIHVELAPLP